MSRTRWLSSGSFLQVESTTSADPRAARRFPLRTRDDESTGSVRAGIAFVTSVVVVVWLDSFPDFSLSEGEVPRLFLQ